MKTLGFLIFFAAVFMLPLSAMSQSSNFGVNVYYGDAVNFGMNVHVAPTITLRPELGLTNTSGSGSSLLVSSHLTYAVGLDIVVLLDSSFAAKDLQPYVGGGAKYWYDEQRFEGPVPAKATLRRLSIEGFVGGVYWLGPHFGIFGEVGVSVGDDPNFDGSYYNFSTLTRIGLNLMF